MKKTLICTVCCGLISVGGGLAQETAKAPAEVKPTATDSAHSAVLAGDGKSAGTEPGRSAPVNDYKGMQEREEVFAFAKNPEVTRLRQEATVGAGGQRSEGGRQTWAISFQTTAACDATVAIVDKDGKIVRHLASGVLGKNAPWPFKQNSLAQSLEWDGKDDRGEPVNSEQSIVNRGEATDIRSPITVHSPPFRVRVGLGLKPTFDRMICPPGDPRIETVKGLAVGRDGTLYVLSAPYANRISVLALNREGKYLRTIMPFPPNLPPERLKGAGLFDLGGVKLPARLYPPKQDIPWGVSGIDEGYIREQVRQQTVISPDGYLLMSGGTLGKGTYRPYTPIGTDGSLPDETAGLTLKAVGKLGRDGSGQPFAGPDLCAPRYSCFSPDGKTLYMNTGADFSCGLGGRHGTEKELTGARPRANAVYSLAYGTPDAAPRLFAGEHGKPGNDETHLDDPRGVACDKDGNVYIADRANDRIQVFKPDGKFLRTLLAEWPDQLYVHPGTGAVYYYSLKPNPGQHRVIKLSPDGQVAAQVLLPPNGRNQSSGSASTHVFCLDPWMDPPVIWVGGGPHATGGSPSGGATLTKLVDRGQKLEQTFQLTEKELAGRPGVVRNGSGYGLAVDRTGDIAYSCRGWKVDGATGKFTDMPWAVNVFAVAPDGTPWTAGTPLTVGGPLDAAGKTVKLPNPIPPMLSCFEAGWQGTRSFAIAPNGDVYVQYSQAALLQALKLNRLPEGPFKQALVQMKDDLEKTYAGSIGYTEGLVVHFGPDGALKRFGVLGHLTYSANSLRVDAAGNLYVVNGIPNRGAPAFLKGAPGAYIPRGDYGTLYKFGPQGGDFRRIGYDPKKPETLPAGYAPTVGPYAVKGALWDYHGMSPMTLGGGNCICDEGQADLDLFGRAFLPDVKTYSVHVVDANGNRVCRFGAYGNWDCQGPKSGIPEPAIPFRFPQYVGVSDAACYVDDLPGCRIVRAALNYHAEETVELK